MVSAFYCSNSSLWPLERGAGFLSGEGRGLSREAGSPDAAQSLEEWGTAALSRGSACEEQAEVHQPLPCLRMRPYDSRSAGG